MSVLDEIKSRIDIADVAGQYVTLKRSGSVFKSPCPFHAEKTPSFVVDPRRGSWRCFGACNEGGDVFGLVMRADKVEFKEALRRLAERARVALPERVGARRVDARLEERICGLNELAGEWFRQQLAAAVGDEARRYLEGRGMGVEVAREHGVGFAPSGLNTLRDHLRNRGVSDKHILEAKLARVTDSGVLSDFFAGRVTIEIRDLKGRLIGFGARSLDGSGPKYLNTPETAVFNKLRTLYGINRAHQAIRVQRQAVIVEGYTDVITAHRFNYGTVLATMGVSLSGEHLRVIGGLVGSHEMSTVTLCLDADQAGADATLRNLEKIFGIAAELRMNLRVVQQAERKDPDELIRAAPSEWQAVLDGAVPALDFMLGAYKKVFDVNTGEGRVELVKRLGSAIGMLRSDYERDRYVTKLAGELETDEHALWSLLVPSNDARRREGERERAKSGWSKRPADVVRRGGEKLSAGALLKNPSRHLEDHLLKLLLECENIRDIGVVVDETLFIDTVNRQLFERWRAGGDFVAEMDELDGLLSARIEELERNVDLPPTSESARIAEFNSCVARLKERNAKQRLVEEAELLGAPDGTAEQVSSSVLATVGELHEIYKAREFKL